MSSVTPAGVFLQLGSTWDLSSSLLDSQRVQKAATIYPFKAHPKKTLGNVVPDWWVKKQDSTSQIIAVAQSNCLTIQSPLQSASTRSQEAHHNKATHPQNKETPTQNAPTNTPHPQPKGAKRRAQGLGWPSWSCGTWARWDSPPRSSRLRLLTSTVILFFFEGATWSSWGAFAVQFFWPVVFLGLLWVLFGVFHLDSHRMTHMSFGIYMSQSKVSQPALGKLTDTETQGEHQKT